MAIYQLKTFGDIVSAVREELKIPSTDTTNINRIKRDINTVYAEIVGAKRWWWLIEQATVQVPNFYSGTGMAFTGNSKIISSSIIGPSKKGHLFSVEGDSTVYRIESHSAGGTDIKLSERYMGPSNLAINFKIWTDHVPLPTNCKETVEVVSNITGQPLENLGHQEWRRFTSAQPKRQGPAEAYYTSDFIEAFPTASISSLPVLLSRQSDGVVKTLIFESGLPASLIPGLQITIEGSNQPSYNGNNFIARIQTTNVSNDTLVFIGKEDYTEAAIPDSDMVISLANTTANRSRYRHLYFYPALNSAKTILHIDYQKQVMPLENDSDEPIIPVDDRMILRYGALHLGWSRERNPEEASRNFTLYTAKFTNMAGQIQDSLDKPILKPSKIYLGAKRKSFRTRRFNLALDDGWVQSVGGSTGGSTVAILGVPNTVATFNADGELEGSNAISVAELNYLDGTSANIQDQIDDINTVLASQFVTNANITTNAAIARSKLASGTASRVVVNDGSGVMTDASITSTELSFLSGVTPLTTALLNDNQVAAATAFTIPLTNNYCFILYSLKRGAANIEGGFMIMINDGSSADLTIDSSMIGTTGVTLTADVSGSDMRLRYTSTSTGVAPSLKYAVIKWAA